MFLDSNVGIEEHIQNVLHKVSKRIGLLRKLQKILSRPPLKELQNCNQKLFLRPPKNKRKHNQHFELLFFMINLHFGPSN